MTAVIYRKGDGERSQVGREEDSQPVMTCRAVYRRHIAVVVILSHTGSDFFFVIRGAGAGQGEVGAFQREREEREGAGYILG